MTSALPLLIGGGALFLMSGKKKKRRSKSKPKNETETETPPKELPGLDDDEDLDATPPSRPIPGPAPTPGPDQPSLPGPTPAPPFEPSDPHGKPAIGPTGVGSCANTFYTRDPEYITPDILLANGALSMWSEPNYFFYIRRDFQKQLYDYMLNRFSSMSSGQESRTVASVVLREALKHFNSGCRWENPIATLDEPEQMVWDGGRRLAILAQVTAGLEDPGPQDLFQTGERFTITRKSLGTPDPGFMGASEKQKLIGRRVEIIATDSTQENAEHIIGEILRLVGPNNEPNLFEVRILDTFGGADVRPRLRTKHGFKTGSNAYFSQQGPTGIYRIFPEGMQ